jgi:hypothetical protein
MVIATKDNTTNLVLFDALKSLAKLSKLGVIHRLDKRMKHSINFSSFKVHQYCWKLDNLLRTQCQIIVTCRFKVDCYQVIKLLE